MVLLRHKDVRKDLIFILTTIALIVIGVLIFELIIFIHEFGHFITAKKFGVQVNEFAIGMGPKLFQFEKGETKYSIRLLPVGGYCALEGENEESDNKRALVNKPVWQRMIIVLAGAFNNIVLGLIMMMILMGQSSAFSSTTIAGFAQAAFTSKSGLQAGDKIVEIGDYNINCARDISFALALMEIKTVDGNDFSIYKEDCGYTLLRQYTALKENDYAEDELLEITKAFDEGIQKINVCTTKEEADKITADTVAQVNKLAKTDYVPEEREFMPERRRFRTDVDVIRNGQKITVENVDFYTYLGDDDEPAVALDFSVEPIKKNIGTLITESAKNTYSVVKVVWISLSGLVTGRFGMNDIAGPVGTASVVKEAAQVGLESGFGEAVNNILYVMMIITVNLGIVNVLPLPALDGGRFLFMLIEVIIRKPVPQKYEAAIHTVGFLILLAFIGFITINDIVKVFNGTGFIG